MQFLYGSALTKKMLALCSKSEAAKIAIAYWGSNSLKLLHLNPKRNNLRILCCLKGGKSDPEVIRKFYSRARQEDRLHAKVIWTTRGAIIGSANASSNGLPEEENSAVGLIEAGVFLDDTASLNAIQKWFDMQYRVAKHISRNDLKVAMLERNRRLWNNEIAPKKGKRQLVEALRTGGKLEFGQQRIALVLWKEATSTKVDKSVRNFVRQNAAKIESTLNLPQPSANNLVWYTDWNDLPLNTFLIDCEMGRRRITSIEVHKTFDVKTNWAIKVDGRKESVTFALMSG